MIGNSTMSLAQFLFIALFAVSTVVTIVSGQFVYNYEESDDLPTDSEQTSYQPLDPSTETKQLEPSVEYWNNPEETPRTGIRRTTIRRVTSGSRSENNPEESNEQVSQNDRQELRNRRRKIRKMLREKNEANPIVQPPAVFSPSAFQNIGLGEAPRGVYIPQDSILNVLKNPSGTQTMPVQYQNIQPALPSVSYIQPVQSNVGNTAAGSFESNLQNFGFFLKPPTLEEVGNFNNLPFPTFGSSAVQYVPESGTNYSDQQPDVTTARPQRANTRRRQRQQTQRHTNTEPVVDIDVLRSPPDVVKDESPEIRQRTQARSISSTTPRRQIIVIQRNSVQSPRSYSPSAFQDIGLGEAPSGIHIPHDSLLNILRNPSHTHASPRTQTRSTDTTAQPVENTELEPQGDLLPVDGDQSDYTTSRRRPGQRPRATGVLRRNSSRRTEAIPVNEDDTSSSHERQRQRPSSDAFPQSRRTQSSTPRRQTAMQREPERTDQTQSEKKYKPAKLSIAALPEDTDDDGIPGEAGVNYPTFHVIPRTAFACSQQEYNGYYADMDTDCQVVHLCQAGGVKSSFLCPNGTIFSQEKFSCQWWYKVNCADSPKFFSINDSLYKIPEDSRRRN